MGSVSCPKGVDMKKKLEGYKVCSGKCLEQLMPGDRVRYMMNNEFRGGGAVKMNRYPDYVVLMNVMTKATWCMQLKNPTLKVWVRKMEKVSKEREDMAKIYKMYKEGKLVKK
jgi:hypothetical protein